MADDRPIPGIPDDRRALALQNAIGMLREVIEQEKAAVNEGRGDELVSGTPLTRSIWLEGLEADLLEAEVNLEFLRAKIEGADE